MNENSNLSDQSKSLRNAYLDLERLHGQIWEQLSCLHRAPLEKTCPELAWDLRRCQLRIYFLLAYQCSAFPGQDRYRLLHDRAQRDLSAVPFHNR